MTPLANIRNATRQLAHEGWRAVMRGIQPAPAALESRFSDLIEKVRADGAAVIPDFLTRAQCQELTSIIDRSLERYREHAQIDQEGSDHRLFGLDHVSPEIRRVAFDENVLRAIQSYEGSRRYDGFALGARMIARPGNKGSGGGWHRDSAAEKQTKLLIYLTDVGKDNGPFEYIVGSHRPLDIVRAVYRYGLHVNQYRLSDDEVNRMIADAPERRRTVLAPAGTAFIADTRCIHRGMPILSGERYSITTYLWFDSKAPEHVRKLTLQARMG
jgi:hypothetical protein